MAESKFIEVVLARWGRNRFWYLGFTAVFIGASMVHGASGQAPTLGGVLLFATGILGPVVAAVFNRVIIVEKPTMDLRIRYLFLGKSFYDRSLGRATRIIARYVLITPRSVMGRSVQDLSTEMEKKKGFRSSFSQGHLVVVYGDDREIVIGYEKDKNKLSNRGRALSSVSGLSFEMIANY